MGIKKNTAGDVAEKKPAKKVETKPAAKPEVKDKPVKQEKTADFTLADMGRKELADLIREDIATQGLAVSQKVAVALVASFEKTILKALSEGISVSLTGFGRFTAEHKEAHEARNPATGQKVAVPAKNVFKFKAGKALKESVKQ